MFQCIHVFASPALENSEWTLPLLRTLPITTSFERTAGRNCPPRRNSHKSWWIYRVQCADNKVTTRVSKIKANITELNSIALAVSSRQSHVHLASEISWPVKTKNNTRKKLTYRPRAGKANLADKSLWHVFAISHEIVNNFKISNSGCVDWFWENLRGSSEYMHSWSKLTLFFENYSNNIFSFQNFQRFI